MTRSLKPITGNGAEAIDKMKPPGGALPWWYELITSTIVSPIADTKRAIFTNRTLRMARVRAVGFDFDHTLAVYNCAALDHLAMDLVIDRLIKVEGLKSDYFDNLPNPAFACKGLVVDVTMGNVLKIDRHGHVARVYHGQDRLSPDEKRKLYGDSDYIPHVTHGGRFVQVDSAFAKPEVLIYSTVAPRIDEKKRGDLWKTIRGHTDMIHRDGSLKKSLMERPLDFLQPDLETVGMLRQLKEAGKTVFFLTNSEWEYTLAMAGPALGYGPSNSLEWLELFDHVVVEARKPDYFKPRKPTAPPTAVDHGKVIRGGNIAELEEKLGCEGPEVLYVGDHIYSDLITSKRTQSWRTMLIIAEVEQEMESGADLPGIAMQLKQADERRTDAERELHHWQSVESAIQRLKDPDHVDVVQRVKRLCATKVRQSKRALNEHIQLRERLLTRLSDATNPFWGSLFRTNSELTYFGRQVEDFACTYTSRASNIGLYSTEHYFRSAMDYLPHELESM
jgi:5'-nucleotidase